MRGAASESAAAPVLHNVAGPVKLNDVCHTKLKLLYQTDSDAALLPNLIHQLGSAHEWSSVWIGPQASVHVITLTKILRSKRQPSNLFPVANFPLVINSVDKPNICFCSPLTQPQIQMFSILSSDKHYMF